MSSDPKRRDHPTRAAIVDATEAIIREQGHAAVSSRKVAARAGLKSQLVHYYFRTMDDLFMAVLHRVEEQHFARLAAAAAAPAPLRAMWALLSDPHGPRLTKEFIALATHREPLRQEIARSAGRTRDMLVAALADAIAAQGIDAAAFPPPALAILLDGAARLIVSDTLMGLSGGHAEAIAFVEQYIARAEAGRPRMGESDER